MTYCVAMRLERGLVFLSDSRTNAGIDQISTFRKMTVFERPGDRVLVLLTAGNLAISQAVRQLLAEPPDAAAPSIWTARTMLEAARLVGDAVRMVHERDAASLEAFGIEFSVNMILGGQIGAERPRLFQVYAPGNFIEAQDEAPYLQIGESKYGKPIIDRVVTPATPLDEAAKCALISMDSTLRSNVSAGLPLDLLVYERGTLAVTRFVQIDHANAYFAMIRDTWGKRLRQVFQEIPDPRWDAPADDEPAETAGPTPTLAPHSPRQSRPMRVHPPGAAAAGDSGTRALQAAAQSPGTPG